MGQRDRAELITLAPAASVAASDAGAAVEGLFTAESLRVQLHVTAVAGVSPTLDVVIEDTLDGVNWNTIGTFTQKAGPSRQVIDITTPFADRVRARWTIAGTSPSFTFSVIAFVQ